MPPCAVAAHGVAGLAERRAFQAEAPACLCEIRCVQLVLRGVPPSTVPATLALTLRAEGFEQYRCDRTLSMVRKQTAHASHA